MEISWDEAKNDKLKAERGISFEELSPTSLSLAES